MATRLTFVLGALDFDFGSSQAQQSKGVRHLDRRAKLRLWVIFRPSFPLHSTPVLLGRRRQRICPKPRSISFWPRALGGGALCLTTKAAQARRRVRYSAAEPRNGVIPANLLLMLGMGNVLKQDVEWISYGTGGQTHRNENTAATLPGRSW